MAYDKLVSLQGLISEPTDSNLLVAGAMMDFIKVAKDSINERDAVQRIHQRCRDLYKSRKRGKRDFLPDELVIHFIAYRRNELPENLRIEWTQWREIERNGKRNRILNEFWDEFRRFKPDKQGEKSDFLSFQMNDSRSTELKLLFRSGEVIVFNPQHVTPAVQQWLSEPARKRVPPPVVDLVPDRGALVREKLFVWTNWPIDQLKLAIDTLDPAEIQSMYVAGERLRGLVIQGERNARISSSNLNQSIILRVLKDVLERLDT